MQFYYGLLEWLRLCINLQSSPLETDPPKVHIDELHERVAHSFTTLNRCLFLPKIL
jgi:hypothetical protein